MVLSNLGTLECLANLGSILQARNKSSSRTVSNPRGDGRRECEVRAHQQVRQLVKLVSASVSVQCHFSVEQPASSLMLKTDAFEKILCFPNVQIVYLDQCCYGLRPPDYDGTVDNRVRKRTAIITNPTRSRSTHAIALPGQQPLTYKVCGPTSFNRWDFNKVRPYASTDAS